MTGRPPLPARLRIALSALGARRARARGDLEAYRRHILAIIDLAFGQASEDPPDAEASGLPFDLGIIRNHYVGRTFIQPGDSIRHMGVKLKHNANRQVIDGKRVILVDDSIVRGTTSRKIVQMVRDAGASEVHMCIASPPTMGACYYGVDTPEADKLLASRMSIKEMAEFIHVDSLAFLTIDGLYRAVGEAARKGDAPQFCDACFTRDYPTALTDKDGPDNVRQLSLLAGNG